MKEKLENFINQALKFDEENLTAILQLEGRIIAIDIDYLDLTVYLSFSQQGIGINTSCDETVDVTIKASPITLLAFVLVKNRGKTVNAGDMEITGDVGLAQDFQSILKSLDIDWEEFYARFVGDYPARKLGNFLRGARQYANELRQTLGMDIGEYFRYEKDLLPDQVELSEYSASVDVIRNDAERLQQRIKRLDNMLLQNT